MGRFARTMGVLGGAMALFRLVPGLAATWCSAAALPLLHVLHRLTAALPFPALEPLALIALLCCLRRRPRAVALAMIVGMYGLLWYPAYFAAPVPDRETPDPARLEALCVQLTEALNASPLQFDSPYEAAGEVAGLPWAAVKPVRYPEWMRAMDIAGLFSPWTGEALADSGAPPGYAPFTCVHELMHLKGIADEGQANRAAYEACVEYGGMFADSARLWALRYALGALDDPARARVTRRMDERLRGMLIPAEPRDASWLSKLMGISPMTRDYDALPFWIMSGMD